MVHSLSTFIAIRTEKPEWAESVPGQSHTQARNKKVWEQQGNVFRLVKAGTVSRRSGRFRDSSETQLGNKNVVKLQNSRWVGGNGWATVGLVASSGPPK